MVTIFSYLNSSKKMKKLGSIIPAYVVFRGLLVPRKSIFLRSSLPKTNVSF
jgi:hypothetical protein